MPQPHGCLWVALWVGGCGDAIPHPYPQAPTPTTHGGCPTPMQITSWWSCWQPTVAWSSTEAEYMSMCDCTQQILWIKSLFHECHLTLDYAIMFGNNKGAINIAWNPIMEGQAKHIDIKYYFLWECVKRSDFLLDWVPTTQQLADLMTKNLTWQLFQENFSQLNLLPFKS